MSFVYCVTVHATPKAEDRNNCPVLSTIGLLSELLDVVIDEKTGIFEKPSELSPKKIEECVDKAAEELKTSVTIFRL